MEEGNKGEEDEKTQKEKLMIIVEHFNISVKVNIERNNRRREKR